MKSGCSPTVCELLLAALALGACGSESVAPVGRVGTGAAARPRPVKIAAGSHHACALMTDGTMRCWGDNSAGQLGHACTKGWAGGYGASVCYVAAPVYADDMLAVPFDDVVDIALGSYRSYAVVSDGTAWCWGDNSLGECATGEAGATVTFPPIKTPLEHVVELSPGGVSCAVLGDMSLWCWGYGPGATKPSQSLWDEQVAAVPPRSPYCIVLPDHSVMCRGGNHHGEVGDGTFEDRETYTKVVEIDDAIAVARYGLVSCALRSSGMVSCWGLGGFLGDGTADDSPTPVAVLLSAPAVAIAAGCAIAADSAVWCWGDNSWGQLGDGTTDDRLTPVRVVGLDGVVQVAGAGSFACALRSDRTVWCWGRNRWGQLGDGTTHDRLTPVQVVGLDQVEQVAMGGDFTCALRSDQTVWCWGGNWYGQLGSGYADGPRGEDHARASALPVRVVFADELGHD